MTTDKRDLMARIAAADRELVKIARGMAQNPRAGMWRSKAGRWSDEIDSLLALAAEND